MGTYSCFFCCKFINIFLKLYATIVQIDVCFLHKCAHIFYAFLLLFISCHAAKDYVDSDPSGRRGLPVTTIKQGAEPPTFTGWFQAWDPEMWEKDPLDRIRAHF